MLDKIVKIAFAGIVATGIGGCIEFRQNPQQPEHKQYKYITGGWKDCECKSGDSSYCDGCFYVDCLRDNDCSYPNPVCSNHHCVECGSLSPKNLCDVDEKCSGNRCIPKFNGR